MSRLQPEKIDVITQAPDGSTNLIVAEVEPWTGEDEQLLALQQKLKNYTAFALDGQLARDYPRSARKPVIIQLDYTNTVPDKIQKLLDAANATWGTPELGFIARKVSLGRES